MERNTQKSFAINFFFAQPNKGNNTKPINQSIVLANRSREMMRRSLYENDYYGDAVTLDRLRAIALFFVCVCMCVWNCGRSAKTANFGGNIFLVTSAK
jgi:hypothetical protein